MSFCDDSIGIILPKGGDELLNQIERNQTALPHLPTLAVAGQVDGHLSARERRVMEGSGGGRGERMGGEGRRRRGGEG